MGRLQVKKLCKISLDQIAKFTLHIACRILHFYVLLALQMLLCVQIEQTLYRSKVQDCCTLCASVTTIELVELIQHNNRPLIGEVKTLIARTPFVKKKKLKTEPLSFINFR